MTPLARRPAVVSLLAIWILVAVTASIGSATLEVFEEKDPTSGTVAATSTTLASPDEDPDTQLPALGQIRITGLLGAVDVQGRLSDDVELPLTFDPLERGFGNGGEIEGLVFGDSPATVIWDGGRSLVLEGEGRLSFDESMIRLNDGLMSSNVGGVVADLRPGNYVVASPVALGRAGLAEPRDRVEFSVQANQPVTLAFSGDVSVGLTGREALIVGPGQGTFTGLFTVTEADGTTRDASDVTMGPDSQFEIKATPVAGGWLVNALVQGNVTTT